MGAAVVCESLCKPLGIDPPLHRRRAEFFVKDRAFSNVKARRELGFAPEVSVKEGMARTARWYRDQGHLTA
jgi:nucleoside-diphosphate-sugar epimerase